MGEFASVSSAPAAVAGLEVCNEVEEGRVEARGGLVVRVSRYAGVSWGPLVVGTSLASSASAYAILPSAAPSVSS